VQRERERERERERLMSEVMKMEKTIYGVQ
jgi:hypothetical protein